MQERSAGGGEHHGVHVAELLTLQALEQAGVLRIDRGDARSGCRGEFPDERCSDHHRLLAGQCDVPPGGQGSPQRRESSHAGYGSYDRVSFKRSDPGRRVRALQQPEAARQPVLQPGSCRSVRTYRFRTEFPCLLEQQFRIRTGCQTADAVTTPASAFKLLGTDRTGAAQDRDCSHAPIMTRAPVMLRGGSRKWVRPATTHASSPQSYRRCGSTYWAPGRSGYRVPTLQRVLPAATCSSVRLPQARLPRCSRASGCRRWALVSSNCSALTAAHARATCG